MPMCRHALPCGAALAFQDWLVDKTLLVAEATFDRAGPHIGGIAAGMTVALLAGLLILNAGLPGWITVVSIIALLVGLALIKARFGPPEMRVEKFDDEEVARIAGRFANATIRDKYSRDIGEVVIEDNGDLRIDLADAGNPHSVWLRQPAFKRQSLELLANIMRDLQAVPKSELHQRYNRSYNDLKVYDAKNMLLVRLTEKPSYMAMMWLVSALTVGFWLLMAPLIFGG